MCDIYTNDNGFGPTTFILYRPISRLNNLTAFMDVTKKIPFHSLNNNNMDIHKQYNKNNKVVSSLEQTN